MGRGNLESQCQSERELSTILDHLTGQTVAMMLTGQCRAGLHLDQTA